MIDKANKMDCVPDDLKGICEALGLDCSGKKCMQIDNGTKTLLMNASESRIVALDIGFARQRNKSSGIAHWDKDVIRSPGTPRMVEPFHYCATGRKRSCI